eukprot:g12520.t1
MVLRQLSPLIALTLLPVTSFVLPSGRLLIAPTSTNSKVYSVRHGNDAAASASATTTASTCTRRGSANTGDVTMDLEPSPIGRRELLRAVGGAIASLGVAATLTGSPDQASAAAATASASGVARRPGNKRSPVFLCDDAVSYLYNPTKNSEIWIVGTAHISNSSATLVENTIREIKPQVVMVELDAQRVGSFLEESMKGDPAFAESAGGDKPPPSERKRTPFFGAFFKQLLDPSVSVNDRVTEFFAAALGKAISKMYESMDQKGLASGQEFTIAIREARACGAKLLLGDRDVQVTLRRLSEALRSIDLQALSQDGQLELGLGLDTLDGSSAESINTSLEKLKKRQTMRTVVGFYKQEAPELYNAMIGERDMVMATNLMTLEGKQTTVAVVGLAHVDGIESILAANGWKLQRC